MNIKKSLVAAGAITTLGLGLLGGVEVTHAATTGTGPMSGLVNAIAQRFNLNPADVQKVFDDQHQQMIAQHEQTMKDHLAQAVTAGQLTQTQADQITAKQQELRDFFNSLNGLSASDKQTAIKNKMTELQQWAKDNSIPLQYLKPGLGGLHHDSWGRRGHLLKWHMTASPTPTPTNS